MLFLLPFVVASSSLADPCSGVECPQNYTCLKHATGIPFCAHRACRDVVCPPGTHCDVDTAGSSACLVHSHDPCKHITCAKGSRCVVDTWGNAFCVNDTSDPMPVPRYEVGCFKSNTRFLTRQSGWTTNTLDLCAGQCAGLGHKYAGVEFGSQCWCGDSMAGTVKTVGAECEAMRCSGDSSEFCGGGYRVRVFSLEGPPMQPAAEEVGCFAVDSAGRNLDELEFTSDGNTVEECTSVCEWNGFKYAGLEFRDECWCGNTLPDERVGGGECSLPCAGDASQMCGHGYKANVYVVDGSSVSAPTATYEGCYTDTLPRTLPVLAFKDTTGMTVEKCVAVCGHNGYAFAGLQAKRECWCGGSLPVDKLSEGNCRMPCSGDSSQICGYAWRNSVYSITV